MTEFKAGNYCPASTTTRRRTRRERRSKEEQQQLCGGVRCSFFLASFYAVVHVHVERASLMRAFCINCSIAYEGQQVAQVKTKGKKNAAT